MALTSNVAANAKTAYNTITSGLSTLKNAYSSSFFGGGIMGNPPSPVPGAAAVAGKKIAGGLVTPTPTTVSSATLQKNNYPATTTVPPKITYPPATQPPISPASTPPVGATNLPTTLPPSSPTPADASKGPSQGYLGGQQVNITYDNNGKPTYTAPDGSIVNPNQGGGQSNPSGVPTFPGDTNGAATSTTTAPDGTTAPGTTSFNNTGVDNTTLQGANANVNSNTPEYYTNDQKRQQMLNDQLSAIKAQYDVERNQATTQTANEGKSQLAGLYGVGVVNPLSSGVASLGAANNESLTRRLTAINAQELADRQSAVSNIYGLQTAAEDAANKNAQTNRTDTEQQIQSEYANTRQGWTDAWTNINNVVNLWKTNQEVNTQQKQTAQSTVTNLLQQFGSRGLPIDAKQQAELEQAAGYPKGSISNALSMIKTKEMLGTLNIQKLEDGSLVNIGIGADGFPAPELLVKGGLNGQSTLAFDRINSLRDSAYALPEVKSYPETAQTWQQLNQAAGLKNGVGDLTFLYNVARMINPGIGVRGNEFDNFNSALGVLAGLGVKVEGAYNGVKLNDAARNQFLALAQQKYAQQTAEYNSVIAPIVTQAQNNGIDPTLVLPVWNGQGQNTSAAPAAPTGGTGAAPAAGGSQWGNWL